MIKDIDFRKQELAENLGLQFDEVKDLFSVETLESMDMVQISGGGAPGVDGTCTFVRCIHSKCTHGDCSHGTCLDGECTDIITQAPTQKPTSGPTPPLKEV